MALKEQQKPKLHHRKAHGHHHRHTKHYLKTYWPYLPMLLLVGAGIVLNSLWYSKGAVLGDATSLAAEQIVAQTNVQRQQKDETTLVENPQLASAAQAKASDMVARNYWSHTTPDGKSPWSFLDGAGYSYQLAGENLAYGFDNPDAVVNGWMQSPEHRANILNQDFSQIGIGVASSKNFQGKGPETIVVALYAQPSASSIGISFRVNGPAETSAAVTNQPYRSVSRVSQLTHGTAGWSAGALSILIFVALILLTFKHVIVWHRVIRRGESFVLHHKTLDVALVAIIIAAILLTQTAGYIR